MLTLVRGFLIYSLARSRVLEVAHCLRVDDVIAVVRERVASGEGMGRRTGCGLDSSVTARARNRRRRAAGIGHPRRPVQTRRMLFHLTPSRDMRRESGRRRRRRPARSRGVGVPLMLLLPPCNEPHSASYANNDFTFRRNPSERLRIDTDVFTELRKGEVCVAYEKTSSESHRWNKNIFIARTHRSVPGEKVPF